MASLSASFNVGSGSASALIKSASSLSNELATYQDDVARINYDNSAKTDADLATYSAYLNSRVTTLQGSGSVTDATKAIELQQTIVTAQKSNSSANIQRENIQVMAGNASLSDKYNVIVNEFQTAVATGDDALAQSLESQAYSVSQSIQYQAQEASSASATLERANATAEGDIVTSLSNSLKQLNNDIKNVGQVGADKITQEWVNKNSSQLQSMGVIVPPGSQPNYFDLVKGIAAAQYNAYVLKAQVQQTYDPATAQNTLESAQNLQTGVTKLSTLGGSLTYQQLTQAAQDPNMFAFDAASGTYKITQQTGYQYINGQVAPTYSGITGQKQFDQVYILNADQTKQMGQLGLNFSQNKSGTTGDGVTFQVSNNTPQWMKNILGDTGESQMYTDSAGNLVFKGTSTDASSSSFYTLATVNGLSGLFEHLPDGSMQLAGGNYGFNVGAAQLLVNMAQNQQAQIKIQQSDEAAQAKILQAAAPPPLPSINVTPPPATASTAAKPQNTISTSSVQNANGNPQNASKNSGQAVQNSAGNIQSGGSGIKITGTTAPTGIKI